MENRLPSLVAQLTQFFNAWIVGSAAKPAANFTTMRDFDVLVPFQSWNSACILIPKDAKVNSFGGWKCVSDGCEVDVWPDHLTSFLTNHVSSIYMFHPRSGTRIGKV